MRLLIVKLSSLGDVIHTLPALTDLAAARPDLEADWLVEEAFADLVRAHPAVAEVHSVSLRRLRWPPSRWPSLMAHRRDLARTLRARSYDMVLDVQGLVKSAVLARLAGAPIVGFDASYAREPSATRFYARMLKPDGTRHVVDQLRQFFADAVGYPMPAGTGRVGLRRPARDANLPLPRRYGIAVTAAGWPTKLWPEDRWGTLLRRIAGFGIDVVLPWGNAEERERAQRIAGSEARLQVLPDRLDTNALLAAAANADFAIGLDTGLMHLTAAFDVPGLCLFGPTDPNYARPYGEGQRAIASDHPDAPCQQVRCTREPGGDCCMRRIAVEAVWREVGDLLPAHATRST